MENNTYLEEIHSAIKKFFKNKKSKFLPGETPIWTGLAIYDDKEVSAVIESLISQKLGLSTRGKEFEKKFAEFCEVDYCSLVNSGSSASLLALEAMKEKLKLKEGEIITAACGFPTTVNPIIQLGFTPVFVDVDETYNIAPETISKAITNKTVGIVLAHTLGNPARIEEIMIIAKEKNLFVVEDCCDAYGSLYNGKKCGSFGDISITSFYPAHNITLLGEGGAVMTKDPTLHRIIRSLRDWGKDCHCEAGQDNACMNRFNHTINGKPYDHKYIFSRLGYNLKPTEAQAAMGLEQLKRLEEFNNKRRGNFIKLKERFKDFEEYFDLIKINKKADPVLFGFPLMIRNKKIDRRDLVIFLNKNKIATRYLFGGNLIHQPAYKDSGYKTSGELKKSDEILENLFWIGIHPGLTDEIIDYIISKFKEYIEKL